MKRPRGPIRQHARLFTGRVGPLKVEFWYQPKRFAITMGDWYILRGDRWELYQSADWRSDVPKLPGAVASDDLPYPPRKGSQALKAFKAVNEYLADTIWPGGVPMGEVQLSLRTRAGRVVAQLKLQDHGGLRISVEGAHVDDALAGLEAALSVDPAPWERDPYPLGGDAKKKKK